MLNLWSEKLLSNSEVTFTITATPSNASVTINGIATKSLKVKIGDTVTWKVSASGYYTQTGTETITCDTIKTISLKSRTTTFAVSSLTTGTGTSSGLKTRYYRAGYSFKSGNSYTVKITFGARADYGYNGYTSTSSSVNTSGTPATKTQQWAADKSSISSGTTKTVTFTASANASYLFLTLIDSSSAPKLNRSVYVTHNS